MLAPKNNFPKHKLQTFDFCPFTFQKSTPSDTGVADKKYLATDLNTEGSF
jgi:hypothetical protein